jgi:hypothetical protein
MEVRLRSPHPYGSDRFRIVRVGADIGLECVGCQHRLFLERQRFEARWRRED